VTSTPSFYRASVGSYYLTAMAIVLAIPIVALAMVAGLARWARDVLSRSPLVGALGVLFTASSLVNLFMARACGAGVNRPIVALAVGDGACHRTGLVSLQLVVLLVVTTATVVRLGDVRR
jgi:hypothetical protein